MVSDQWVSVLRFFKLSEADRPRKFKKPRKYEVTPPGFLFQKELLRKILHHHLRMTHRRASPWRQQKRTTCDTFSI